jgi:membrane peptidoglycan carboxypeptidase
MLEVAPKQNVALPGQQVAAKTGTAQLEGSATENRDAWMVGFTPTVSTAVWVGSDKSDPIRNAQGRPIFGSGLPGQIWHEFMKTATDDAPPERFSQFVPIGDPPQDDAPPADDESRDDDEDSDDEDSDSDEDRDNDSRRSSDDDGGSSNNDSSDSNGSGDDDGNRPASVNQRNGGSSGASNGQSSNGTGGDDGPGR